MENPPPFSSISFECLLSPFALRTWITLKKAAYSTLYPFRSAKDLFRRLKEQFSGFIIIPITIRTRVKILRFFVLITKIRYKRKYLFWQLFQINSSQKFVQELFNASGFFFQPHKSLPIREIQCIFGYTGKLNSIFFHFCCQT